MSSNLYTKELDMVSSEIPTTCKKEVSNGQKWTISLLSAVLFILISMPLLYKLTNRIIPGILDTRGAPAATGILVHSIVFLLVTRLVMLP